MADFLVNFNKDLNSEESRAKRRAKMKALHDNEVPFDFCGLQIMVDKDRLKEYHEWVEKVSLPFDKIGAIGGEFTYCITPTSIGPVYVVKHVTVGENFNLTNYGTW